MTLNVLNWATTSTKHARAVQQEYPNIKIKYSTAASNEEMLIKLSRRIRFTISASVGYTIEKMIAQNMLTS